MVGAGILGLWQALLLARAGHAVRVVDRSATPFAESASRYAGAMIAPYCEAESAEPVVRDLGLEAAKIWRAHYPDLIQRGSLVVANARDQGELRRFARLTVGHETVDDARIAKLEPDLAGIIAIGGPAVEIAYIQLGGLHRYQLGWLGGVPMWIALWWVLAILIWDDLSACRPGAGPSGSPPNASPGAAGSAAGRRRIARPSSSFPSRGAMIRDPEPRP